MSRKPPGIVYVALGAVVTGSGWIAAAIQRHKAKRLAEKLAEKDKTIAGGWDWCQKVRAEEKPQERQIGE